MGGRLAATLATFPPGARQRAAAAAALISSTSVRMAALRSRYPAPDATTGITSSDGLGTGGANCVSDSTVGASDSATTSPWATSVTALRLGNGASAVRNRGAYWPGGMSMRMAVVRSVRLVVFA